MPLTCSCPDYDDDAAYWYEPPEDYSVLRTKRSRKCKSCGEKIAVGDLTAEFTRWRFPRSDTEIRIFGEDWRLYLADWFFCEECADQYFNLTELGFCIGPDENVQELLAEYVEMTRAQKA